ncbi:hypothetical protein VPH35_025356 [Triticum aestivum]
MACYQENSGRGLSGSTKVLICLWLLALFVRSSDAEEVGLKGCEFNDWSKTWNKICVKRGTCNTPCRAEGWEKGACFFINHCLCYKNCSPSPAT